MKIHSPINALPPRTAVTPHPPHRTDRKPAYEAARRAPGKWVPVDCGNHREALYLANGARHHSTYLLEAEQRGDTVYLRFVGRRGFQPIRVPSADLQARETLERIGA